MDELATTGLVLLAIVLYLNYSRGTLGDWFRAKFFNSANPIPKSVTGGLTGSASSLMGSLLRRPVPGPITSGFGVPRAGHTHQGVDFAASEGDPISAAIGGTVTAVTSGGDCGNRVDVDAGRGIVTRYCHLSSFAVHQGDHVDAGQTIGAVGHTGDATGPHLHFEVIVNGTPVDPAPLFGEATTPSSSPAPSSHGSFTA